MRTLHEWNARRTSRRKDSVRRAFVALTVSVSVLSAVGCIWIVDPQDAGDRCLFRGRGSDCGTCITQRCQTEVDACCGDTSCGGLVGLVEGCAEAGDHRCDEIHAAASSAGERGALAECVTARCRGVCERTDETSATRCGEIRLSATTACACLPATEELRPNRYRCDSALFPNTRCCASPGWPSAGNECACLVVACTPLRDGCSCFLSSTHDATATARCQGRICCQGDRSCRCGEAACRPSEVQVPECSVETIACGEGAMSVDRCSLP